MTTKRNICAVCCLLIGVLTTGKTYGQTHYVVDTLVVMDFPAFTKWVARQPTSLTSNQREESAREKIKEYISLVIRQVNLRLDSLTDSTNDWTIQLSVADFNIGSNPLKASANLISKMILYDTAIQSMRIWVAANGYNQQYDYVILLTGYDLKSPVSLPYEIQGIANIGTLCQTDGTSLAVVEDKGGFQSVHFVAHEMGHSLGSKHDGESPNINCPDRDRYLMSIKPAEVTSLNVFNPWYFSTCSKRSIVNHVVENILKDHPSCLTNSKPEANEFRVSKDMLPGQVYNVKEQCQHLYGQASTVCLGDNFKLSEVCTSMFCLDTSAGSGGLKCLEHRAAEGSSCGNGKICQRGRCLDSPLAPSTKFTDCYFGDLIVAIEGSYSCSQYTAMRPESCYLPSIQSACCDSCAKVARSSTVCPYGDKQSGCYLDICQHINLDGTRFEEVCCETCGYDVIKKCVDVSRIDGMTCAKRVNVNGVQGCYNTSVAYHCCETCAGLRRNVNGCEYGDKTTDNTCKGLIFSESNCRQSGKQCCQTCGNLGTHMGGAWKLQAPGKTTMGFFLLFWLVFVV